MEDEVEELEGTDVEDVASAEESAGFAASFDEARDDESPANEEQEAVEQEAESADSQDDAVEAKAPQPDMPVAGVTGEQLTAMLAKLPEIDKLGDMTSSELRKVHGKIGELNRTLQELQKNSAAKGSLSLAGKSFKRLNEEFPEIAEILAADLNEAGFAGGSNDQARLEPLVNERVLQVQEQMQRDMQMNLLKIQHRDYLDVVKGDDFKVWMQTIPVEDQKQINDTWDAMYLGEKISAFKSWRDKRNEGSFSRKERLQRAITPKGLQQKAQQSALSEEDGFRAAFR
jgi:hypothetical protein